MVMKITILLEFKYHSHFLLSNTINKIYQTFLLNILISQLITCHLIPCFLCQNAIQIVSLVFFCCLDAMESKTLYSFSPREKFYNNVPLEKVIHTPVQSLNFFRWVAFCFDESRLLYNGPLQKQMLPPVDYTLSKS